MRSWLKDKTLFKDTNGLMILSLYKSMAYDYDYANLDPIQKAVVSYLLVNYHQIDAPENVKNDLKEISQTFIEYHGPNVVSDVCTMISNQELVSEYLEYFEELQ